MTMAADIARHLDPGLWFQGAGIDADPWQVNAMRSGSKRQLWNVHRQGGKSTSAGLRAIAAAAEEPDAPILVISPSQRQSQETVRTCLGLHARITGLPPIIQESAHRIEFENRSRILSLPASETTVRGFAKVRLLILDEASRIPDEIVAACRPMLAVSDGAIIALSTPAGRRGFFYEWWHDAGDTWEKTQIRVDQCGRITKEFLDEELKILGPSMFRQEYHCEFVENDEQVFAGAIIEAAFSTEVRPIW